MSMISGQVDRLRTAAQTYRRLGNHSAESMLLDAADTIWELRDDLQRANAENAKLREEFNKMDVWHSKELTAAMAENAKLRELVRQMYPKAKVFLQMGVRLGCNDTLSYDWYLQLRELGVEVSE